MRRAVPVDGFATHLAPVLLQAGVRLAQVVPWNLGVNVVRHVHADVVRQELHPARRVRDFSAQPDIQNISSPSMGASQRQSSSTALPIPEHMLDLGRRRTSRLPKQVLARTHCNTRDAPLGEVAVHSARQLRLSGVPALSRPERDVRCGVVDHLNPDPPECCHVSTFSSNCRDC